LDIIGPGQNSIFGIRITAGGRLKADAGRAVAGRFIIGLFRRTAGKLT